MIGKYRVGGLCIYVNNSRCTNRTIAYLLYNIYNTWLLSADPFICYKSLHMSLLLQFMYHQMLMLKYP